MALQYSNICATIIGSIGASIVESTGRNSFRRIQLIRQEVNRHAACNISPFAE